MNSIRAGRKQWTQGLADGTANHARDRLNAACVPPRTPRRYCNQADVRTGADGACEAIESAVVARDRRRNVKSPPSLLPVT